MKKIFYILVLVSGFLWSQVPKNISKDLPQNSSLTPLKTVKQSKTNNPLGKPVTSFPKDNGGGTLILTNALSQEIEEGRELACARNDESFFLDNNLFQIFYLEEDFGIENFFTVTSVQYANGPITTPTGFPITINLYQIDEEEDLLTGWETMELLATAVHTAQESEAWTFTTVPITATVDAGKLLVMELVLIDDETESHFMRFGANTFGYIRDSYVMAPGCNVYEPMEVSNVEDAGGAMLHDYGFVWNIFGEAGDFVCEVPEVLLSLVDAVGEPFGESCDAESEYFIQVKLSGGNGNPTYSIYIGDELQTSGAVSGLTYNFGPFTAGNKNFEVKVEGNTHNQCTIIDEIKSPDCKDLSVDSPEFQTFKYHPNPMGSQLNLSAASPIEHLEIYNMAGQKIVERFPKTREVQVNTEHLAPAVYIMKVSIAGQQKTFKMMKK